MIRSCFLAVCMGVFVMFSFVCFSYAKETKDTDAVVVAEVDGETITLNDLKEAAKKASPRGFIGLNEEERKTILANIVAEKLIYKQALSIGFDKKEDVVKELERTRIATVNRLFLNQEITSKVNVTQEEITSYYEQHKADFTPPSKAHVVKMHVLKENNKGVLMPDKARMIAEEIMRGVSEGKKGFREMREAVNDADFIGTMSEEESAVVQQGMYYKTTDFDKTLFSMADNEVRVIEVPDRFIVIKLDKIEKYSPYPIETVEGEIKLTISRNKWSELFSAFIEEIKKKFKVDVHRDNIK